MPPLPAYRIAEAHRTALQDAGSFTRTEQGTVTAPSIEDGSSQSRSVARVDLTAGTVAERAEPEPGVTVNSYAEGATVYERTDSEAFPTPGYEVKEIGRPLDERLVGTGEVASILAGVDYQFTGTVTRDGATLARYTAEGTEAVADRTVFSGEEETLTGFSSTVLLDPKTDIVRRLHVERTTDYATTANELATIETTLVFEEVGSTAVERPGWVETAIAQAD